MSERSIISLELFVAISDHKTSPVNQIESPLSSKWPIYINEALNKQIPSKLSYICCQLKHSGKINDTWTTDGRINSSAPGRFEWNFKWVFFKVVFVINRWSFCCEVALRWMSLDLTDDKSTFVQVDLCRHKVSLGHNELKWPPFRTKLSPLELSWFEQIWTRHQRMHAAACGLIREYGNISRATRVAKLGKKIESFLKTHHISVHTKNQLGQVDSLAGGGQKQPFSPNFINFFTTRGPKFGQRDPKANQLWTLTQWYI